MTSEEIKTALVKKAPIRHNDRQHQTAIVYAYAQACRVYADQRGNLVSTLELVSGGNARSIVIARAEDCELFRGAGE